MQIRSVYGVWFLILFFCCCYFCVQNECVNVSVFDLAYAFSGGCFFFVVVHTNRDRNFSGFVKLGDSEIKWWHMHSFDHVFLYVVVVYLSCPQCRSFPWTLIKVDWLDWIQTLLNIARDFFFFPSVFPFCFIDFFLICQEVYSLTASLRFNKLNAACFFFFFDLLFTSSSR